LGKLHGDGLYQSSRPDSNILRPVIQEGVFLHVAAVSNLQIGGKQTRIAASALCPHSSQFRAVYQQGEAGYPIRREFLKGVSQVPIAKTSISKKWRVSQTVLKSFFLFENSRTRMNPMRHLIRSRVESVPCLECETSIVRLAWAGFWKRVGRFAGCIENAYLTGPLFTIPGVLSTSFAQNDHFLDHDFPVFDSFSIPGDGIRASRTLD
jgi:hypothetical protein